ncbi:MAG TPA: uracil-DNA glycosylase family protein [Cyclobacteriaceae bacterium]|nr:uracil-DNA glycosylase family protein [Cyclobacteriaceae bacterium]
MFADNILSFYKQLSITEKLPKGVIVMNPYQDDYTFELCRNFYTRFYNDKNPRTLLLGINPGRFGSGTTGISFTDPVKLENEYGIANTLTKKAELSADFMFKMMTAFGGPKEFYRHYFISSVSPLGFTKDGININYYDDKKLERAIIPFIVDSIEKMIAFGCNQEVCFCIGEGKNFDFLSKLNEKQKWFKEIKGLPHPRFIMQYRRKRVDEYVDIYLKELSKS